MKDQRGFTLVELMTASVLAGILFASAVPLFLMGQRAVRRQQRIAEAALAGDQIFEELSKELVFAGDIWIGDEGGSPLDAESWTAVYENVYHDRMDLELCVQDLGETSLYLRVRLADGDAVLYERAETLILLNRSTEKERQNLSVSGKINGDGATLWYQKASEVIQE
jgi:prepilin-type N-terminal cleavage/methylation domain-containing protein